MPTRRLSLLALAALALWPSLGAAQVINRPDRAFRGLFGGNRPSDPNRSRQELTFTLNALGGHDDNAAAGDGLGAPTAPNPLDGGGYTGVADATLAYFHGRAERAFNLSTGVSYQTYRNVPLEPSRSFVLNGGGNTTLGRRATLSVNEALRYTNQYRLDAPITGGTPIESLPTTDSSLFGLGNRTSITSATSATLEARVARTDRLRGTYSYTTTNYTEGDFGGYRAHDVIASYGHQIGRWTQLTSQYGRTTTQFAFSAGDEGRNMTEDRLGAGATWDKRLSPRRSLQVALDAGAMRLDSATGTAVLVPFTIWSPYATLAARMDLGRDWNLGGNYRRGAETLEGLTSEPFLNDGGTFTLSGLVTRRVDLAFIAGFARGATAADEGPDSKYVTSLGSAQVRVAISRTLSAIASYHFYHYKFDNTVLPAGVASEFDRGAVRVGFSLWLPLFGTSQGR